ncbi:uncharacterized protein MELLADRAFT_89733 [Melampsora larici-populina 98AG31]|uniref:Uncharacterized protein n=1 Tax=Melampsora larici-populina (strain 98AG31 / pathotype 3-4-7) TaxID=747676 RepID=F4RUF3_MELLP|nr:uncharacterized protein MELLADRAFT_89733 [Melampsora larici-populina 98AG31]EGG03925.1 hypothetical protein MELLADRAFT_89733 [Melampsora larici-populina 98AG31]
MLDPGAPGVTKQMMLDWLRKNHPKSPIPSTFNKNQAAVKVREKQPEFFPDPKSDRPATFIHGDLIFGSSRIGTSGPDMRSRLPSSKETKPILPQPSREETKPSFPQPSTVPEASMDTPVKRAALPTPTIVLQNALISKNMKDKKGKKVAFLQAPTRVASKSVVDVMELTSQHDINLLRREAPAMSPLAHQIVPSPLIEQRDMLEVKPKIQPTHDLIDLSDGDLLSVGNLKINVPPLRFPTSKVKSGVDVFHEEQARAEKVDVLEASVAELLNKIECVKRQASDNMAQLEDEKWKRGKLTCILDTLIYFKF